MAIVKRKPRNSSLRFQTYIDSSDITKKEPEKSLVKGLLRKRGGRNCYGRITVRHRGGGAKRRYRIIDFKRIERDVPGKIIAVEYDPNRNVRVGLVLYKNGAKGYILLPEGIQVGSAVMASKDAEAKPGNAMPLAKVPIGFMIHNIEIVPGKGGTFVRSAGTAAQLISRDEKYAILKLPSGETRLVPVSCWATIGVLGNADYKNISWGKAGRIRHIGFRPTVRGMAMNPVDHPHGGGEGRSKSGSHPRTPWGKGCKGTKTRKRKNPLILKKRSKNR
ncbi:50S ribosomal protein L2 [Candidatus Dependentiae bacterium]|nr:MAG: 50S ribosomal protein L2 [Candidatus Dependentiae bacterium]